jgi:hypothetical protein
MLSSHYRTAQDNAVTHSLDVSSHPETEMGMETEESDHGGQDSYLDNDDYEVSSSSEYTDSDTSTWSSMAESIPAADTAKTNGATDTARIHEEDNNSTSQTFQRIRPAPRIPLALQNAYLKSCMGLEVEEPPPRAAVYIFQRVSLCVSRPVSGIRYPLWSALALFYVHNLNNFIFMQLSPQQYLEDSLRERGYSTDRFKSVDTGYYRKPTPLQIASYDKHVLKMIVLHVHYGKSKGLHDVLSCGISPDACNTYGESLVHRVCKASNKKLLQVFLNHGASVQFANDYGRTPLHEVCLATKPCFINFEEVLKRDPHLIFLTDVLGATPFSYIRREHYDSWIRNLEEILDVYWPRHCIPKQDRPGPPPLSLEKPRSVPLPDPVNALPVKLAGLVASGKLEFPIR